MLAVSKPSEVGARVVSIAATEASAAADPPAAVIW